MDPRRIGAPWAEASPEKASRRNLELSRLSMGDDATPRTSVDSSIGTPDRPAGSMLEGGTYLGEDQKERDLMEAFAKRFATVKCFDSAATASPGGEASPCGNARKPALATLSAIHPPRPSALTDDNSACWMVGGAAHAALPGVLYLESFTDLLRTLYLVSPLPSLALSCSPRPPSHSTQGRVLS